MKCISLGYLIVIVIILMILSSSYSGMTSTVFSYLATGAVIYYLAGFFLKCD